VVIGPGRTELEKSIVLVENCRYRGFGYVDETFSARKLADFRDVIKEYTDNKDIQQIIRNHLRTKRKGERVKVFG
jgi:DNA polymerase-3 subunit epsilon